MALQVYSTLTRKKELFETIEPGKVRMYVCGPTVYDKAHVGHAMSALVFDIIRRYLQFSGYEVRHIMNFTDVDDKIILRAAKLGVDPFELAEGRFQVDFLELLQGVPVTDFLLDHILDYELHLLMDRHVIEFFVHGSSRFPLSTDTLSGLLP